MVDFVPPLPNATSKLCLCLWHRRLEAGWAP